MKRLIPFLLCFAALTFLNGAMAHAATVPASNSIRPDLPLESPSGGPTTTVIVSVTLIPGLAANLMYTDSQGSITQLDFPANAVTQTTTIALDIDQRTSPIPEFIWTGHLFHMLAFQNGDLNKGFNFEAPITITLEYSDSDILGVPHEDWLKLYWWSGSNWIDSVSTCTPPTDLYAPSRYESHQCPSLPLIDLRAVCHIPEFPAGGFSLIDRLRRRQ